MRIGDYAQLASNVSADTFDDIEIVDLDVRRTLPSMTAGSMRLFFLRLNAPPPDLKWQALFTEEREGRFEFSRRSAWIEETHIVVDCLPEDVEKQVIDLAKSIAYANEEYRVHLKRLVELRKRSVEIAQDEQVQLERLRMRVRDLGHPASTRSVRPPVARTGVSADTAPASAAEPIVAVTPAESPPPVAPEIDNAIAWVPADVIEQEPAPTVVTETVLAIDIAMPAADAAPVDPPLASGSAAASAPERPTTDTEAAATNADALSTEPAAAADPATPPAPATTEIVDSGDPEFELRRRELRRRLRAALAADNKEPDRGNA